VHNATHLDQVMDKTLLLYICVISLCFKNNQLELLALVLQWFANAGLKLKPSKCLVEFLGYFITPGGIQPNSIRISAVQDFPRPPSVKVIFRLGIIQ